jgi:hypothetical protein
MRLRRLNPRPAAHRPRVRITRRESLAFSILVMALPLVAVLWPGALLRCVAIDQLLTAALAIASAVRLRRSDVLVWCPTFVIIRVINCFVWVRTFWTEVVRGKSLDVWFTPERYERRTDDHAHTQARRHFVRKTICSFIVSVRADRLGCRAADDAACVRDAAGFVLDLDRQRGSCGGPVTTSRRVQWSKGSLRGGAARGSPGRSSPSPSPPTPPDTTGTTSTRSHRRQLQRRIGNGVLQAGAGVMFETDPSTGDDRHPTAFVGYWAGWQGDVSAHARGRGPAYPAASTSAPGC